MFIYIVERERSVYNISVIVMIGLLLLVYLYNGLKFRQTRKQTNKIC